MNAAHLRPTAAEVSAPGPGPASGPVVNALTVDLEDWYQGLQIPIEDWSPYEDRVVLATERLLDILAAADVRATFFTLGFVAERHPGLVARVAAAGHEIATHGYSHSLVYELEPQQFREELRRSRQTLQQLSGQPVLGHRAPFFSITRRSLWALAILAEEGLAYDSSIFPVRNWRYGIEDAPRWPHRPAEAPELVEFPISTWRLRGRNLPMTGGAYFRIYPYAVSRRLMRQANAQGHAVAFYIHPWELDPGHPRISLPRRIALTHYFNLAGTERRLRRLLKEFRFAPMGELVGVL
jgi:polysaccharide deacetylase family protein (PEP-CTERM system associated)